MIIVVNCHYDTGVGAPLLLQHGNEFLHCLCRKHLARLEREFEDCGKPMNPFPTLLLGHPETFGMIFLNGIDLQIDKDEEETVWDCDRGELA